MKNTHKLLLAISIIMILLSSCDDNVSPKARAFFRIDIPKHDYIRYEKGPYSFDYADYAVVSNSNKKDHPYWLFLDYPKFNARIYLSYSTVGDDISIMINDAHDLAFKHIAVANDIREKYVGFPENHVYGLIYSIKGAKVASPINFFVTDSTTNFVRGALYFNESPQNDSLAPVIDGIGKDIIKMLSSLKWEEVADEK